MRRTEAVNRLRVLVGFAARVLQGHATQLRGTERVTRKSIDTVASQYDSALTRLAHAAERGRVSASDMARQHRTLIREYGRKVYVEGLVAGGVDADELDDADERNIAVWVSGQLSHISDFAKTAAAANDDYLRMGIENRLDAWVRSLVALGGIGRMSAQSNVMATWKMSLNPEEHCRTCHSLHNVRHRLRWFLSRGYIPREPGSKTLECNGFNCQCRLQDDRGKQLI